MLTELQEGFSIKSELVSPENKHRRLNNNVGV